MAQPTPRTLEIDFPPQDDWLSPQELASLTPAILRQRMLELKPLIASRARAVERARRPDPEVWRALRRSGIFYMFVPKRFGGLEMGVEDLIDVMIPVGEACASTCWCTTFVIEHNLGIARGFPEATQARLFKEFPYVTAPGAAAPTGTLTPTEGGYLLTGHWRWGSGIMNSDWVLVGALKPRAEGEPPEICSAILPSSKVTVLDTWYTDGMSGTGSNDFVIDKVFVPEAHVGPAPINPNDLVGAGVHDGALFRIPFQTLLALTTMLPALGAARAALALALEKAGNRIITGSQARFAEKESHQIRLARADTLVRASELLLRDAARQMMAIGAASRAEFAARSQVRAQVMLVMSHCRDAIRIVADATGASAHHVDNPIQRALRDVQVISSHALYESELVYEQRGRALLGLPQTDILT